MRLQAVVVVTSPQIVVAAYNCVHTPPSVHFATKTRSDARELHHLVAPGV